MGTHDKINALVRRGGGKRDFSVSLLTHKEVTWAHSKMATTYKPRTKSASMLTLDLPIFGTVRNKYLLFEPPSLWYFTPVAKLTNTAHISGLVTLILNRLPQGNMSLTAWVSGKMEPWENDVWCMVILLRGIYRDGDALYKQEPKSILKIVVTYMQHKIYPLDHFKVYSSGVLSTSILCHHCYWSAELFSSCETETQYPSNSNSPFRLLQPPQPPFYFVSIRWWLI